LALILGTGAIGNPLVLNGAPLIGLAQPGGAAHQALPPPPPALVHDQIVGGFPGVPLDHAHWAGVLLHAGGNLAFQSKRDVILRRRRLAALEVLKAQGSAADCCVEAIIRDLKSGERDEEMQQRAIETLGAIGEAVAAASDCLECMLISTTTHKAVRRAATRELDKMRKRQLQAGTVQAMAAKARLRLKHDELGIALNSAKFLNQVGQLTARQIGDTIKRCVSDEEFDTLLVVLMQCHPRLLYTHLSTLKTAVPGRTPKQEIGLRMLLSKVKRWHCRVVAFLLVQKFSDGLLGHIPGNLSKEMLDSV